LWEARGRGVGRPTAAVDYVSGLGFVGEDGLSFCICHFKLDFVGKRIERLLGRWREMRRGRSE